MSSTSSWWASITSALSTTAPSTPAAGPPQLQEVLLAKAPAVPSRRESIRQLRERADALQRELEATVDQTVAADVATRHAERRAGEAVAEIHAVTMTSQKHDEKLREMEAELRRRNARIKLLEAILATLTKK